MPSLLRLRCGLLPHAVLLCGADLNGRCPCSGQSVKGWDRTSLAMAMNRPKTPNERVTNVHLSNVRFAF